MKLGYEYRRTSIQQFFDKDFRGKLSFAPVSATLCPSPATSQTGCGSLSSFLEGIVNSGCGKVFNYFGYPTRHTFENSHGVYFQDSFHLFPRFPLNYGLRWDYFGVVTEKNHLFSNFDTTADTLVPVGPGGLSRLYEPDYRNFAPRLSAAWDVFGTGKTVVRSGFGIFYYAFSQDFFLGHLPYPPFFDPRPAYNAIGPAQTLPAQATGTIALNVPVYGPPGCSNVECDIFGVDRNIKTPYMENYNFNINQPISTKLVLQLGYVGSQGHRLFRFLDISQPSAATIFATECPNSPAPGQ